MNAGMRNAARHCPARMITNVRALDGSIHCSKNSFLPFDIDSAVQHMSTLNIMQCAPTLKTIADAGFLN